MTITGRLEETLWELRQEEARVESLLADKRREIAAVQATMAMLAVSG